MKKVAIIGCVGLPAKYGGWESLVDQLTKRLANSFEFTVFCSGKKYIEKLEEYNNSKLIYINLDANGIQSIFYDIFSMLKAIKFADTLLILGVSGCIFLPILKLISNKKIIVNIDGLEWRRAKWGKVAKWFLKLSEAVAVRHADVVIADNKAIQDYVKKTYLRDSFLIAYGGDNATRSIVNDKVFIKYNLLQKKYAFKVCRIEPENNIKIIISSFKEYFGYDLVIVGNWSNSDYGSSLKSEYGDMEHVHLIDPIYEQDILNQLRSACSVYIHGHSAGGTNPSLVEAMSLELPIVAYDCIFNRETTEDQALFFGSSSELEIILKKTSFEFLKDNAVRMKNIATRRYTWNEVSIDYANIF